MKRVKITAAVMAAAVLCTAIGGCGRGSDTPEANYGGVSGGSGGKSQEMTGGDSGMVQGTPPVDSWEAPAEMAPEWDVMGQEGGIYVNGVFDMAAEPDGGFWGGSPENWNTEEYSSIKEMGYRSVANEPLSTFSADVDTAAYSNLRRMIEDGYRLEDIPAGAVRIEEMLNYFSYDYALPQGEEPFGVTTMMGDCPWNKDARLLQIGLKTEEIDFSEAPDSNLVFLLDVSGSMYSDDKLPLLQRAFSLLTQELTEKDRVSIITYAGSEAVLLEGVSGDRKEEIIEALEGLEAGGSTNGAGAIETAYRLAEEYYIEGGNNRILLATDGDLNVGISSESELERLVTKKKESGVFLSVLGFGTGNLKDNKMETLADKGNGNYAYIDSLGEAKKVLVEQMGATLVTVAKDVKLQVEFNPAYVKGYRLLGYENRTLATEDFDDDKKDAGEIGAGHMVTVLYEIIPVDSPQEIPQTELKYQDQSGNAGVKNGEWMNLKIRYKEPESDSSRLCAYPITQDAYRKEPSADFRFAAAVAEFGLLLRDSEYKRDASFENVRELLKGADTENDEYKDEFAWLVRKLQRNG